MKKIIITSLFLLACIFTNAQQFSFTVRLNSGNPSSQYYVWCRVIYNDLTESNAVPAGPVNPLTPTSFPVTYPMTCSISVTPPPPPSMPKNYIKLRVYVSEDGVLTRYYDGEWLPYSSSGWTVNYGYEYSF